MESQSAPGLAQPESRLAVGALFFLAFVYTVSVFFTEFFAPYGVNSRSREHPWAPPQGITFFDGQGRFTLRPHVVGLKSARDPRTLRRIFEADSSNVRPLSFLVKGDPYKVLGLIEADRHFFGVEGGYLFLCGTDSIGRDLFSRILYGGRVSLTVGLVGVFISLIIGSVMGVMSGFYGGYVDLFVQRTVELLLSFPSIPLWMALAAALPREWNPLQMYFAITLILSIIGWGGLARQLRGKVMAFREIEFVLAARSLGASDWRIISHHLLPNCTSHIIVVATLAIPGMILGETALSFLGLGIRPPMVSWGVLLKDAQSIRAIGQTPWLIIPVFFVITAVLAYDFVGDGLRDAADPYAE